MRHLTIKQRIYSILERTDRKNYLREIFEHFILAVIIINVVAIVLETVEGFLLGYRSIFITFELFTIFVFSVEYTLRIWTITESEKYRHPVWGRLKFMISPFALIDFFAILPFYLPLIISINYRVVRISQILRLFRIFKMGRYFRDWEIFLLVFRKKKRELRITLYTIIIILVFSSSIIYFIENPNQPEVFSSIPAAMWWGVSTLTTVGYGDIVPVTFFGKFFGSIIALMGIGLFALPAGILGSGFIDQIITKNRNKIRCPYCSKDIVINEEKRKKNLISRLFRR